MTWQLSNHEANVSPLPCLTPFEGPCVAHEPYSSCLQSPNNKASLTHYTHSAKVHSEKCKSDHVFPLSKILPLILITYRIKSKLLNRQAWASQVWPQFPVQPHLLPLPATMFYYCGNLCKCSMRLLYTCFTLSGIFYPVSCIKFKSSPFLRLLRISPTLWNLIESPSPGLAIVYQPSSYYCFYHTHLAKYLLHICLAIWTGRQGLNFIQAWFSSFKPKTWHVLVNGKTFLELIYQRM